VSATHFHPNPGIHRAQNERLFLITRHEPTKEDLESYTRRFVVLGSVGNVYDIEICRYALAIHIICVL